MDKVNLHEGDQLKILPETNELRLGCCNCGAIHYIKVIHRGKNMLLKFVSKEDLEN